MKSTSHTLYFIFLILFVSGCSKKGEVKPPDVAPLSMLGTSNPSSITATSAYIDGVYQGENAKTITAWGFCWSTHSIPTVADSKVNVPLNQVLYATLNGLQEQTTYYARAFATNAAGTTYGNEVSFTTLTLFPIVQISDIFHLGYNYAELDCKLLSSGNSPIVRAGICWSTDPNPTINDDTALDSPVNDEFLPFMDNLTVNTRYYVRAFATNSDGTGYSDTIIVVPAYSIGAVFGGGKIVYIDNTKVHGLIVANEDQGSASWDYHSNVFYTYAWDLYNGAANTDAIINTLGYGYCAATLARGYTGGGYTDWFMPAIYQLHYLFDAKDKIGNVTPGYYWSSTESSNDVASAWVVRMDTQNGSEELWTKNYLYKVRSYRAF